MEHTAQGQYDWTELDMFLRSAAQNNIRFQGYLCGNQNPYYDGYGNYFPGLYNYTSYSDATNFQIPFTNYCKALVTHATQYMAGLRQQHPDWAGASLPITWELWNEPNGGSADDPMQPDMSTDEYMALANVVFPAIRQIDPSATLVGPTLGMVNQPGDNIGYTNGLSYLDEICGKGLLNLIDGVSVHTYRTANPESIVVSVMEQPGRPTITYSDIRSILDQHGGNNVKIVAGEWGYMAESTDFWGVNISMQQQGDYAARMNLVNLSQGIPYTVWYYYQSYRPTGAPPTQNWGIIGLDEALTPAYHALKTLTTTLKDAWFDHQIGAMDPNGANMMVFNKPAPWGNKWMLAAWNAANVSSVNTDSYWGTYTLTGTPLYCGERLSWQGGDTGNWSDNNTWVGGGWPNLAPYGDNYQAQFDNTASINVDGSYRISGLQFNANNVLLWGDGALNFTDGGGNLYTGANNAGIACKITGGGDPSTFVLRKGGTGVVGIGAANDFRGRVLIKEGAIAIGNARSLGDISNPVTLDGGQLITQGVHFETGPVDITAAASAISNYTPGTTGVWKFPYANIGSDFAVVTDATADVELSGQLFCTNSNIYTLTKWNPGTLTISGPGDNVSLKLYAKQGTVNLNKASDFDTHAVAYISGVDPGATVQCTGSGDYQIYGGGTIALTGGTLDFNGHNQIGTHNVTVSTDGSTIANTAAGTASVFSMTRIYMNRNMTVNAVGDLTINGRITYTSSYPTPVYTLTKTGPGLLTLNNETTSSSRYRGGTIINEGNLLFATAASHPSYGMTLIHAGGALVAAGAYTTVADWLHSDTLGRIDPASTGALALAADNSENINMGSYASLSLGSTGDHTYSGTLTPANNTYRFGGGGGTITVASPLVNGTASRSLIVSGNVTLAGANTYSGSTTVNAGALLRIAATATLSASSNGITVNGGKLLVNSTAPLTRSITMGGGTLGGNGRYVGNLTLGNGHLSPGDGGIGTMTQQGNLTLDADSVFDFDLGSTPGSGDRWAFDGAGCGLILDGTLNIAANGPVAAGNYVLFSGLTSITDNGLDFGVTPTSHEWSYAVQQHAGYYDVVVTAAPEPGTMMILATALAGLLFYTWRKSVGQALRA